VENYTNVQKLILSLSQEDQEKLLQIIEKLDWSGARLREEPVSFVMAEKSFSVKLGPLEEKLLELLKTKSCSKWELVSLLYPDEGNSLLAENRFKNLLARVRKKCPGVVVCQSGLYQLTFSKKA